MVNNSNSTSEQAQELKIKIMAMLFDAIFPIDYLIATLHQSKPKS
jgi:hypothetical protein